jgi:GNAT superfamily N-acetyltransferase
MTCELRVVATVQEWEWYHSIRRRVLWEARGRPDSYDRTHPDEFKESNFPCLLLTELGEAVGTVRIDVDPPVAWLRRMAVGEGHQRRGFGSKMVELSADFARSRGCRRLRSNVAGDAVGFYRKLGFDVIADEGATASVPMVRQL